MFAKDNQEVDFFCMNLNTERVIYFDRSWSNDVTMESEQYEHGIRYKITNNGKYDAAIEASGFNDRVILKPNYSIYFDAPRVSEYGWGGIDSSRYVLKGQGSRF